MAGGFTADNVLYLHVPVSSLTNEERRRGATVEIMVNHHQECLDSETVLVFEKISLLLSNGK